ncbi:FecR family protein [Reyranella sp.]|jgi:hypothetical protein|uniref:FecR family protein n=1 Tax=Reyranella sp. TaxID=1929291 RepID=UPI002F94597D
MLRLPATVLALCLVVPLAANARVGVTSATDGDPLGKPPAEAERVLRIGIDVQANELITTGAADRAHLVFLDGTSLTVGPDARVVIDKFVFDPATKTGDLAVTASKGVLRLVGGKISKKEPIVVTTPSSTIGVRGGITLIDVDAAKTTATFVFGKDMTVTGQGVTRTATRPGSQVIANFGTVPLPPVLVPQGALAGQMGQLEGNRSAGNAGGSGATGGASKVIVDGTTLLASQPGQHAPTAGPINPAAPYTSVQQWNAANYIAQQAVNPAAYPTTNPNANPNPQTQLPNTGSATFAGTFNGAFVGNNNGPTGTFGGTFSLGWNFASQTGMLNATGTGQSAGTATAPLSLIQNTVVFTGPLTVTRLVNGNSGTGTVAGAFVPQSGNPSGGVTGGFAGTTQTSTFAGAFSGSR